jgi:hypothetical protein
MHGIPHLTSRQCTHPLLRTRYKVKSILEKMNTLSITFSKNCNEVDTKYEFTAEQLDGMWLAGAFMKVPLLCMCSLINMIDQTVALTARPLNSCHLYRLRMSP